VWYFVTEIAEGLFHSLWKKYVKWSWQSFSGLPRHLFFEIMLFEANARVLYLFLLVFRCEGNFFCNNATLYARNQRNAKVAYSFFSFFISLFSFAWKTFLLTLKFVGCLVLLSCSYVNCFRLILSELFVLVYLKNLFYLNAAGRLYFSTTGWSLSADIDMNSGLNLFRIILGSFCP